MQITVCVHITKPRSNGLINYKVSARLALSLDSHQKVDSRIRSNSLRCQRVDPPVLETDQFPSAHPTIRPHRDTGSTSSLEHPGPPLSHITCNQNSHTLNWGLFERTVLGRSAMCLFWKCQKKSAPSWTSSTVICLTVNFADAHCGRK